MEHPDWARVEEQVQVTGTVTPPVDVDTGDTLDGRDAGVGFVAVAGRFGQFDVSERAQSDVTVVGEVAPVLNVAEGKEPVGVR